MAQIFVFNPEFRQLTKKLPDYSDRELVDLYLKNREDILTVFRRRDPLKDISMRNLEQLNKLLQSELTCRGMPVNPFDDRFGLVLDDSDLIPTGNN